LREPTTRAAEHLSGPAYPDQRRRGLDRLQRLRVFGLAERHVSHSDPRRRGEFALGLGARCDLDGAATAPGETRQSVERPRSAAVLVHERAKRARTHLLGADQPQPVDALLVREARAAHPFCPIRPSVPARRRAMF
jgi:hypothetical protein